MRSALCIIAIALLALSHAAAAEMREPGHERAYRELKAGGIVSLQSILDWVRENFEGEVIEVELEPEDDDDPASRLIYEVELLSPQGALIELIFDPKTGALIDTEGGGVEAARKKR